MVIIIGKTRTFPITDSEDFVNSGMSGIKCKSMVLVMIRALK